MKAGSVRTPVTAEVFRAQGPRSTPPSPPCPSQLLGWLNPRVLVGVSMCGGAPRAHAN